MSDKNVSPPLKFDLAERAQPQTLQQQAKIFAKLEFLYQALDAVPNGVTILNRQRQILYANPAFCNLVEINDPTELAGVRLGETLNCIHAFEEDGGCGTSEACTTCGALHAMLEAQRGKKSVKECRITRHLKGELTSMDMRVWATPFVIENETFTIFAAVDIADEKRRNVLERIFFHDIRNTAGVIFGVAEIMRTGMVNDVKDKEFADLLLRATQKLLDEISGQQQLLAAERGELEVDPQPLVSLDILHNVLALYEKHLVAEGRHVQIDVESDLLTLESDSVLLERVIGNMVKNALEACEPGEVVTLGCKQQGQFAQFWVHNPAYMPRHVQLQVFNRSFSTKGKDRGLGTYSIKLISERYLQGKVSFSSSKSQGTVFTAVFPLWPGVA